jgi:hypothetical protein
MHYLPCGIVTEAMAVRIASMSQPTQAEINKLIEQLRAITNVGHVRTIVDAEQQYAAEATNQFQGLVAVSNAFRSFIGDTVVLLNGPWASHASSVPFLHTWLMLRLTQNFQWLCAAEQQALVGYPWPAFSEVRNIFDSAIVSAAVIQGFASMDDADGTTPGKPIDPAEIRRKRVATERIVNDKMTGANSGLSPETLDLLKIIDRMFDWETHGQRHSAAQQLGWLQRKGPLRFVPQFEEMFFAPFLNRYLETAWMVHRLVPLMRPHTAALSAEWTDKWNIINVFLQTCVGSLVSRTGRPVGRGIVELVTTKFPFDANSTLSS